jgi:hypothetical protein
MVASKRADGRARQSPDNTRAFRDAASASPLALRDAARASRMS